uniref:Uncharacterized protein n=1 Tax=Rhizophagus irregularis (strain DAOM 181602 / DAOM 197198 / MUCL 43194) TaxID=747089 RepID=U9U2G6_RHIID
MDEKYEDFLLLVNKKSFRGALSSSAMYELCPAFIKRLLKSNAFGSYAFKANWPSSSQAGSSSLEEVLTNEVTTS